MVSWLDAAISEHCGFELGELQVEWLGDGWDVRGPNVAGESTACSLDASDLEAIRRRVQCDETGYYRPLTGARSLPGGWRVEAHDESSLRALFDVVYPLAAQHIAQESAGSLQVVGLDAVLERQSGRYAKAATLSESGRALATDVVCGQCVREPAWGAFGTMDGPEGTGSTPVGRTAIPCPEPCSIMVSFCREAAQWEADMPARAPANPAVGFAAFETPGNVLREKWLARVAGEVPEEEERSGIPADSRH